MHSLTHSLARSVTHSLIHWISLTDFLDDSSKRCLLRFWGTALNYRNFCLAFIPLPRGSVRKLLAVDCIVESVCIRLAVSVFVVLVISKFSSLRLRRHNWFHSRSQEAGKSPGNYGIWRQTALRSVLPLATKLQSHELIDAPRPLPTKLNIINQLRNQRLVLGRENRQLTASVLTEYKQLLTLHVHFRLHYRRLDDVLSSVAMVTSR